MVSQVVVDPWKYDSLPTDIEGRNIPASFSGFSMRAPCIGRQFFSVTVFPLIVLAYVLLARREERRVIERFGDEYLAYRRRVPMVFRRSCQWREFVTRSHVAEDKHEHLWARPQ